MKLLPIEEDQTLNNRFKEEPECIEVLRLFIEHYKKVGFHKPWIGYFVADDQNEIVGGGGYKGKPTDGKIEISYGTFKKYEGRGIGSEICKQLVLLSLQTDPSIRITARTLPDNMGSIRVLKNLVLPTF
jgi:RimJ/RimL family protein N-acetyltransferase